jgi:hypothetical protein
MNSLDELLRQELPPGVEPIPIPLTGQIELTMKALYKVADKLHGAVTDLELRLATLKELANERSRAVQFYKDRDREILLKGGTKGPGMTYFFHQKASSFFTGVRLHGWSPEEQEGNLAVLLDNVWTLAKTAGEN